MTSIPVYPCSKCGAVCDVRWIRGVTREERAAYRADVDASGVGFLALGQLAWDMKAGAEHGEHLALKCPRCGWGSRTDVLSVEDGEDK